MSIKSGTHHQSTAQFIWMCWKRTNFCSTANKQRTSRKKNKRREEWTKRVRSDFSPHNWVIFFVSARRFLMHSEKRLSKVKTNILSHEHRAQGLWGYDPASPSFYWICNFFAHTILPPSDWTRQPPTQRQNVRWISPDGSSLACEW